MIGENKCLLYDFSFTLILTTKTMRISKLTISYSSLTRTQTASCPSTKSWKTQNSSSAAKWSTPDEISMMNSDCLKSLFVSCVVVECKMVSIRRDDWPIIGSRLPSLLCSRRKLVDTQFDMDMAQLSKVEPHERCVTGFILWIYPSVGLDHLWKTIGNTLSGL